eukprot:4670543-Amphidinium_carterae.2
MGSDTTTPCLPVRRAQPMRVSKMQRPGQSAALLVNSHHEPKPRAVELAHHKVKLVSFAECSCALYLMRALEDSSLTEQEASAIDNL